jgi:hypothetical protein
MGIITSTNLFKEFYNCKIFNCGFIENDVFFMKTGSVSHQVVVPVLSISCCIFNNHYFFEQMQNALAFNCDKGCHLALCLWLIIFLPKKFLENLCSSTLTVSLSFHLCVFLSVKTLKTVIFLRQFLRNIFEI